MKRQHDNGFPDRDAIVAFIRANPGKVGTKEIAREFGLKNADRAELKRILRELADSGTIKKHGKKVTERAQLPATLLADITTRDADGELIATPAEWDEAEGGEPPQDSHPYSPPRPAGHHGRGRRPRAVAHRARQRRRRRLSRPNHQGHRSRQDARAWRVPRSSRWRRPAYSRRQEAGRERVEYLARRYRRRKGRRPRQRRSRARVAASGSPPARSRNGSARYRAKRRSARSRSTLTTFRRRFRATQSPNPRRPSPPR